MAFVVLGREDAAESQNSGGVTLIAVVPAKEPVRKLTIGWISTVRPSRQLLRSFLRMRNFLNAIKDFPHAEERPAGASRSTHSRPAANFLTPSQGGVYCAASRAVQDE
jgi:hypothetical protein